MKDNLYEYVYEENKVGKVLHLVGSLVISIGIIIGLLLCAESAITGIIFISGAIILGVIIMGISEIIYLLDKILDRLDR